MVGGNISIVHVEGYTEEIDRCAISIKNHRIMVNEKKGIY